MKEATIDAPSFRISFGILVLIAFFAVGGAKAAQTEDAEAKAVDDEVNWLFVMNAKSGSFNGKTLTLHKVPPVLMFADRPYRMWGHMDLDGLIKAVSTGPDSFAENPPNAVISTFGGDVPVSATVVLHKPTAEGDSLSFPVEVLEGDIPKEFASASLFIDHWHPHVGAFVVGAAVGSSIAHSRHTDTVVVTQPTYYYQASPPPPPPPPPPPAHTASTQSSKTPEARLGELKGMLDKGLISKDEYDKKKTEILQQM